MSAKALLVAGAGALLLSATALGQADPFAALPGAVTLVLSDGLMLVEDDHGVSNSRTVKIGDEYRDGWKLEAVSAGEATFRKGRGLRTVAFAAPARTPAEAAADAPATGVARLTNADPSKRLARPAKAADRAHIDSAILAGDARQVYALGGSAADVAKAMASTSGPLADILARGGEATFLNVNGRTGLRVNNTSNGDNMNFVAIPPELANTEPPADAIPFNPPRIPPGDVRVESDGEGNTFIRALVPPPGGAQ